MSGQSIQDRMIAAKHSISGQGLAKAVCKATTEEVMGPKKKHLDCKDTFSYNSIVVHVIEEYQALERYYMNRALNFRSYTVHPWTKRLNSSAS